MKTIDRAIEHYKSLGIRSMTIPEWGDLVVYWTPMTLEETDRLVKGEVAYSVSVYADVIVAKAVDADGNKLFDLEDKAKLKRGVDRAVLIKLGSAILAAPSIEDAEKN